MTIGDQPAFPKDGSPYGYPGMTYRQWLVGQIAGMGEWSRFAPEDDDTRAIVADEIVRRADAIIKRLEANE